MKMSEVKWNKGQLDAINARNTSLMVSAAAGSGKTAVLVERLLRILSDNDNKVSADRIVVVTFTNDAAAQMKQRLSEALSEAVAKHPSNNWLAHQQSLINSAKISTIHTFCFDMIRENLQTLDISAGFKILDDADEEILISKAMENVFESFYADPEKAEILNFLTDFTCISERSDSELAELIAKIHRFLMAIPFPMEWLDNAAERYSAFDPATDPFADFYISDAVSRLESLVKKEIHVTTLFASIGEDANMENANFLRYLIEDTVKRLSDRSLGWDKMTDIPAPEISAVTRTKFKAGTPQRNIGQRARDLHKEVLSEYKNIISSFDFTEQMICDDYEKTYAVIKKLSVVLRALIDEINRLKSEKNALSFSDAEQLAVQLLCRRENGAVLPTKLAEDLSEYYSLIMIDEFQDANETQNLIFRMLSHGGTAEKNGDNLFVVGDVKQSIYGFRLANPAIFRNALKSADDYSDEYEGTNARILLNRNYRSSPDVINFANDVFSCIMTETMGGVDYTDGEKLVCGAVYPEKDRSTEVIFVDTLPNSDDEEAEDLSCDEAEARAAAEKIRSMLGIVTVTDHGAERPCREGDFCILMRDRKRGQLYADALRKVGIRASCDETAGYLQSKEIAVLANLLRVIDDPLKDIPLVSVLMSAMFMLTAEEIARIRTLSDKKMYHCVLEAMKGTDNTAKKLCEFKKLYDKMRLCASSQSLENLIRTIYDSTDFLSSVQVWADGEQKRANLRLLLEYAKNYEQNYEGGLSGFIRYLGDISDSGNDLVRASVTPPSDNVVSIKTIHKSKGLEYPFVFLCGTHKGFNVMDERSVMQLDLDYGISFRIQDRETLRSYDSFPRSVMRLISHRSTLSEEMRLLYVALTRAKEQLFITMINNLKTTKLMYALNSAVTAENGISPQIVSRAGSMRDWLISVLITHPDGCELIDDEDERCPTRKSNASVKLEFVSGSQVGIENEDEAENQPSSDEDVKMLTERFSYAYDGNLTETAAKLTITEIAKSTEEATLRMPDFTQSVSGLTAAERGTAMHTFMQYADFERAEKDTRTVAEILAEKGIISDPEKNALQYEKLDRFFKSELYARMKNSPEVCREKKFLIEISQLGLDDELGEEYNNTNGMLQGIADCLFKEDDGYVLVDYKTDRVKTAEVLADRYRMQLKLYSAAMEKITGVKVKEAYLYSFGLDCQVQII